LGKSCVSTEIFVLQYYTTEVPKLISRQFGDEIILANFETGLYYSLAGTAADVWLGIKSGVTLDDIAAAFANSGAPASAIGDVQTFIDQLLAENIISDCSGVPELQPWTPQAGGPYSQPTIERFDDLRDLLFLDPVHDVSEAGWPLQAKDGV
jgi:Coenzyme PQQ synthesis protein D (PqqD)